MKIGDHILIIGGYQDCNDYWRMLVTADQRLVDLHQSSPEGVSIRCDDKETWLEKLPKLVLPATINAIFYIWLD